MYKFASRPSDGNMVGTQNRRPSDRGRVSQDITGAESITVHQEAIERERQWLTEHTNSFYMQDVHIEYEMRVDALEEERGRPFHDRCASHWVVHESNYFRVGWTVIVAASLGYTGTVFLYQLIFLELHIPKEIEPHVALKVIMFVIETVFYIDLFANFFFSYRDQENVEVDSLRMVARQYLTTGQFLVNLFACLPPEVFTDMVAGSTANKASRIIRLQRLSKLFRLLKLGKITMFLNMPKTAKLIRLLGSFRMMRIINFLIFLFWCMHLLACGWYLCAVLETNADATWLARREIKIDQDSTSDLLQNNDPLLQWLHSMYFVMTVFTTVGFGDIAAQSAVEIVYCFVTFMIGTVLNSIIMGEVINNCMRNDEVSNYVTAQKHLVDCFGAHVQLDVRMREALSEWVELDAAEWMTYHYDKDAMKELIQGRYMSRKLMQELPSRLFKGELARNLLFTRLSDSIDLLPPRFPILFALASYHKEIDAGEFVYQRHDLANVMFLVITGTFAHIGVPTQDGGKDISLSNRFANVASGGYHLPPVHPYMLFSRRNYFGDEMLVNRGHRVASVRCEKKGDVIMVERKELISLRTKFPDFADLWKKESQRREWHRQRLVVKLTEGHSFRYLAARTIQKFMRERRSGEWSAMCAHKTSSMMRSMKHKQVGKARETSEEGGWGSSVDSSPSRNDNGYRSSSKCDITSHSDEILRELHHLRHEMNSMKNSVQREFQNLRFESERTPTTVEI